MRKFGLIGFPLSHSFSPNYFADKFSREGIPDCDYQLYPLPNLDNLKSNKDLGSLEGFNVTIPYKVEIISYLDELTEEAERIGAVNCVKCTPAGWIGHNTDAEGFRKSLRPFLTSEHSEALILGTGGASKAVAFTLEKLGINFAYATRAKQTSAPNNVLPYSILTPELINRFKLIVNCTPLGMHPEVDLKPDLPYQAIGKKHLVNDLIYNPKKTAFLKMAENNGAQILNGEDMLHFQAEAAWEFWNN